VTVRVEREGPVTTVIMSRPGTRNAVDGAIAAEYRHGLISLEQAGQGAARFASGAGRHGDFSGSPGSQ
jgi:enoyl-CoA hydratase